jgi:Leucine-rich repeat (LRR) protein
MRGRQGAAPLPGYGTNRRAQPNFTVGDTAVVAKTVQSVLQSACKSGTLRLCNRELAEIPAEVFRITEMDYADKKWWEESEVHTLDVSHNRLSMIPPELTSLALSLRALNASYNSIANVFADLSALKLLVKLDLSHNRLQGDLNRALGGCVEGISSLRELKEVDLSHNALTCVAGFAWLPNLATLNLSNNQLTAFEQEPPPRGLLTSAPFAVLQHLDLSNNALTTLPPLFAGARALLALNASANKITSIPAGALSPALQSLNLRQNGLQELHTVLPNLKDLIIGVNKFTALPDLSGSPEIAFLDASNNQLNSIDRAAKLHKLVRLDLQNNNLTTLPPRLSLCRSLNNVVLDGNPLRGIRREIIAKGTVELLKYLRTRLDENDNDDIVQSTDAVLAQAAAQLQRGSPVTPHSPPVADSGRGGWPPQREEPPVGRASAAGGSTRSSANARGVAPPAAVSAAGLTMLGERNGTAWDLSQSSRGSSAPLLPEVLSTQLLDTTAPATLQVVRGCTSWSLAGQRKLREIDPVLVAHLAPTLHELNISSTAMDSLGFVLAMPLTLIGTPAPPRLQSLIASGCRLQGCFALEWCTARQLVRLDLSRNQLSELPDPLFANMDSLAYVVLSENRFRVFPRVLLRLPNLLELHLASNGLTEVPDGGHLQWPQLQVLDLSCNELQTVPFTLGLMDRTLRSLKLEGNRMRWLRQSVLDKGTVHVLQYLRDKIET